MIENFSDLLSLLCLGNIVLCVGYYVLRSYAKKRQRKMIEKEIEYYRKIY